METEEQRTERVFLAYATAVISGHYANGGVINDVQHAARLLFDARCLTMAHWKEMEQPPAPGS